MLTDFSGNMVRVWQSFFTLLKLNALRLLDYQGVFLFFLARVQVTFSQPTPNPRDGDWLMAESAAVPRH